jgi:D-arabinose 1-dehydrogenase-like Zn-dependent alcohol dehydrogenase
VRGLRLHEWGGSLRLEEMPVPTPGSGEVLVRVQACGVGLTVLNCIRGDLGNDARDLPRVPGHELVGTIEAAGHGAEARVGELVMAYFYLCCATCRRCRAGSESLCERLAGYVGVQRDGGYAPWVVLPAINALPLPAGIDPVLATAIPDAIATPVHIATRAAIAPGERVAVIGAGGGVGVHMVQVARNRGAEVLGLDVGAAKLLFLREELSVEAADSSDFDSVPLAQGSGSTGLDVVVDLLGTEASLSWALRCLRSGGRLALLTTFVGVSIPLDPRELVLREISVVGSRYAGRAEVLAAAAMVADGSVRPVVSRQVTLAGVEGLHDELRASLLLGRGALVWEPR